MLQEFHEHFQELQGPKRLLALSKGGNKHYATPGEHALLGHSGNSVIDEASPYVSSLPSLMALSGSAAVLVLLYHAKPQQRPSRSTCLCAGLYREGDWLLFGAETTGLPEEVCLRPMLIF